MKLKGNRDTHRDELTLILLITTNVVFNLFYLLTKSPILGTKCVFKHQNLESIYLKLNNMSNFHSLEVSETQLQVGENLNKLT